MPNIELLEYQAACCHLILTDGICIVREPFFLFVRHGGLEPPFFIPADQFPVTSRIPYKNKCHTPQVQHFHAKILRGFSYHIHPWISSLRMISSARFRILFIFCTQSIISVDLSSSVTFSFSSRSFTSRRKSCWACSSVSARSERSLPEVSRL